MGWELRCFIPLVALQRQCNVHSTTSDHAAERGGADLDDKDMSSLLTHHVHDLVVTSPFFTCIASGAQQVPPPCSDAVEVRTDVYMALPPSHTTPSSNRHLYDDAMPPPVDGPCGLRADQCVGAKLRGVTPAAAAAAAVVASSGSDAEDKKKIKLEIKVTTSHRSARCRGLAHWTKFKTSFKRSEQEGGGGGGGEGGSNFLPSNPKKIKTFVDDITTALTAAPRPTTPPATATAVEDAALLQLLTATVSRVGSIVIGATWGPLAVTVRKARETLPLLPAGDSSQQSLLVSEVEVAVIAVDVPSEKGVSTYRFVSLALEASSDAPEETLLVLESIAAQWEALYRSSTDPNPSLSGRSSADLDVGGVWSYPEVATRCWLGSLTQQQQLQQDNERHRGVDVTTCNM